MKILFRGLGGAGQRHVRKFQEILGKNSKYYVKNGTWEPYLIKSDFSPDKNINAIEFYKLENLNESAMIEGNFFSVISTRTCDFLEEINEIKEFSSRILIEKPGFNTLEELNYLKKLDKDLYIGLQRRFSPLTVIYEDLLKNRYEEIKKISISVKSNCKKWHPYQSYKDFYALNNSMGGGVLKTECHELISTLIFFEKLELTNAKQIRGFDDSDVYTDLFFEAFLDKVKLSVNLSIASNETERLITVTTKFYIYEIDYGSNIIKIMDLENNKLLKKLAYDDIDLFSRQAISFLSGDNKNSLKELDNSLNLFSQLLKNL